MRKVFSITMIILLLLVSFQQALIIVHFKLNQQRIEREFCVNQARPEMQCHGKCHLKKELEKSDTGDSELTSIGKKIDIALTSYLQFTVPVLKAINSNKIMIYKELALLEPCVEIFVPPPIFVCLSQLIK